jgi:uncharacterized SAM-binding protein YcdF (DUF218 family)
MDYLFSKHLFDLLISASFLIWPLVLILLIIYRKKASLVYVITSMIMGWTITTPAFSSFIMSGLETRFSPFSAADSPTADAIAVLGGSLKTRLSSEQEVALSDSSNRILNASRLYRYKKAPVVIAAGGAEINEPEAYAMRDLMVEWGVPATAILIETKSLNTYENAVNVKPILKSHNINNVLLVTSAIHMPRALATFRSVGINAIPSPTDYKTLDRNNGYLTTFLPDIEAFHGTLRALNEYLGILAYRLRGWIE